MAINVEVKKEIVNSGGWYARDNGVFALLVNGVPYIQNLTVSADRTNYIYDLLLAGKQWLEKVAPAYQEQTPVSPPTSYFYNQWQAFLGSSNVTATERFLSFLMVDGSNSNSTKETLSLIRDHVKHFEEHPVDNILDFHRLLDPRRAKIPRDYYSLALNFSEAAQLNLLHDEEAAHLINKLYHARAANMEHIPEDVTFQEWEAPRVAAPWERGVASLPGEVVKPYPYKYGFSLFNLPLHTIKFRKWLNGAPVHALPKLMEGIPPKTAAGVAISMGEEIISGGKILTERDYFLQAQKAFSSIVAATRGGAKPDYYSTLFQSMVAHRENHNVMLLLDEYFAGEAEVGVKTLPELVDHLVGLSKLKWIRTDQHADFVVASLREFLTPPELMDLLRDVANNGIPLTVTQWKTFLKDRDVYVGSPAAWWISMISKASA